MRLITWVRLCIVVLWGCGLGGFALSAGAQDAPEEGEDDLPTVSYPGGSESGELTVQLDVAKQFCLEVDYQNPEQGIDPCIGGNEAGAAVDIVAIDFELTRESTGEVFWFQMPLIVEPGITFGYMHVLAVPRDIYTLCEVVPDGYLGYADYVREGTGPPVNNCVTFDLNEAGGGALVGFYNVPEEIDELPDTGARLTASPGPGAWVPALVTGALLLTLAGSRLRARRQG